MDIAVGNGSSKLSGLWAILVLKISANIIFKNFDMEPSSSSRETKFYWYCYICRVLQ